MWSFLQQTSMQQRFKCVSNKCWLTMSNHHLVHNMAVKPLSMGHCHLNWSIIQCSMSHNPIRVEQPSAVAVCGQDLSSNCYARAMSLLNYSVAVQIRIGYNSASSHWALSGMHIIFSRTLHGPVLQGREVCFVMFGCPLLHVAHSST